LPPNNPSLRFRLGYVLWQVAMHAMLPVALGYLLWRSRREPAYRRHLGQRFGLAPRQKPGAVWIFAASAGETKAAGPVVDRLLASGHRVVLTHSTPAGLETAARLFAGQPRLVSLYAPLDLFWAVRLFLDRVRPALLVVVEIELWPAMMVESTRAGLPLAHINGNLVERSMARDRARTGGARLALYRLFDVICTKTADFADRFAAIGVPADRVRVVGELKFDQPVNGAQVRAGRRLRGGWAAGRPVLTVASSVQGEEAALRDAIGGLRAMTPRPRIVWVPRSPGRFEAVAGDLQAAGWSVARRSRALGSDLDGELPQECEVLVGDSLGEMDFFLALADLVVVGGSLVDHGGHNIMEPLAQGRPVLMGPSTFGIRFAAEAAGAAGAFQSLPDAAALSQRMRDLLADPEALAAMARRAREFARHHTGAADLTLDALAPYLPEPRP
jgi:3-deoxy-D-manno-octulosonic-acid transferase